MLKNIIIALLFVALISGIYAAYNIGKNVVPPPEETELFRQLSDKVSELKEESLRQKAELSNQDNQIKELSNSNSDLKNQLSQSRAEVEKLNLLLQEKEDSFQADLSEKDKLYDEKVAELQAIIASKDEAILKLMKEKGELQEKYNNTLEGRLQQRKEEIEERGGEMFRDTRSIRDVRGIRMIRGIRSRYDL